MSTETLPLYIGGKFVPGSDATQDVVNPATGEKLARAARATAQETAQAIAAAREAFDRGPWPGFTAQKRGQVLFEVARRLRERATDLARLETLNMGKPLTESDFDVADAATCFEYYGGLATKITGEVNPVPDDAISLTLKEPVGVCGQIIPWNYPLLMAAWKIAPALCAGCTVVLKPAEATPLTAIELAKILDGIADLPKGVVNVVTGDGPVVGAALASSDAVDKIAFTGSTKTGRSIMRASADSNMKRVTLELGGKSPNIFFADANWEAAVEGAVFGVFINQGEVCSAGSRILVEKSIHKKFVEAIVAKARTIALGDPLDRANKMGPLVTAAHRERVMGYVEAGKREGARVALGGSKPGGALARGAYVEPTIFDGVAPNMKIAQEEIFGPVVSVIPFEGEDAAVEIGNGTPYGLAGAVWTRDIYRAFRVVKRLRAGVVWVNHMQPTYVEAPWGGVKMSGQGRELGRYGIEGYMETKQVHINLSEKPVGWVPMAIALLTEIPGPRSRALLDERRRWVSSAISEAKHGIFFEQGEGALLTDVDGNVFIDFMGGIGCMNAGHSAPAVQERAQKQLAALQHTCFQVAPYEGYVALARKLCAIAPGTGPKKAALFNSGAEAVENAIKIARRATGRAAVLAFDPGFHGRTLLALSLTSKAAPYRDGFGPFAPEVYRFPLPDESSVARGIADFHRFLKSTISPAALACAIIEPVLGEGGFIVPPRAFLEDLARTCKENGILLVADEIQSGFGRTGKMFACEHTGLDPDLVVLAKSLSGGLPLSAVVGRAAVMDAPQAGGLGGTFGGNPVACAAALGAIETISAPGFLERATRLGAEVRRAFDRFQQRFPFVGDVRGVGAMQAIELVKDRASREPDKARTEKVIALAAKRGLLLLSAGMGGNVIRTLMPLVIGDAQLAEGLLVLETALAESS